LGFGGDSKGNFRLWIDENLKAEGLSLINNECDETYEPGYLLDPHLNKLNVSY
jgi:hypothetical protein